MLSQRHPPALTHWGLSTRESESLKRLPLVIGGNPMDRRERTQRLEVLGDRVHGPAGEPLRPTGPSSFSTATTRSRLCRSIPT